MINDDRFIFSYKMTKDHDFKNAISENASQAQLIYAPQRLQITGILLSL